jgi:purine-binding chemotaxis protein CheW
MASAIQLVTFRLGQETFGVPIGAVQEVVRVPEVTPVPEAPWFLEGVINLRGRIIPVMDLGRRFRLPPRDRTRATRIVIIDGAGRPAGLIVDAVLEVVRLSQSAVEPPPPMVSGIGVDYITGVGKHRDQLLILLDLAKVLDPQDLHRAEAAGLRVPGVGAELAGAAPQA